MAADVLIYLGDLSALFSNVYQALSPQGLFAFSIEHCKDAWQLSLSGRYQHSAEYIQGMCAQAGLLLRQVNPCQLRLEKNSPVTGEIYIVQKI